MINHINTLQNENHAIILVDVEKGSDKIQHSFMIKILKKSGHEGNIHQCNKGYRL